MPAELATTIEPADDSARLLQAESAVRGYCGWHIAPSRTETLTVRGDGSAVIILPSLHVTDVVSVTANDTVLDADAYFWSPAGVLTREGCGIWWEKSITVEFTHGYIEVPAEVTAAVQGIALRGRSNPAGMAASQNAGPFGMTFSQTVPTEEQRVLDRYKLPPRP